MTIERDLGPSGPLPAGDDLVRFEFRRAGASGLLRDARTLADAAPPELRASFEQALRSAGLASR